MSDMIPKAQSGLELMVLVSYSLLAFSVIYMVFLQSSLVTIKDKRAMESQKLVELVGYEIDIATSMGTGYSKNVTLSDTILGETYNVIVVSNLVVVNSSQSYTTSIITSNITGTILPGDNRIENRDGLIYANS